MTKYKGEMDSLRLALMQILAGYLPHISIFGKSKISIRFETLTRISSLKVVRLSDIFRCLVCLSAMYSGLAGNGSREHSDSEIGANVKYNL